MNLPRLRELVKAWQDGSIREAELHELRDALPEVLLVLTGVQSTVESWERLVEHLKRSDYRYGIRASAKEMRKIIGE